MDLEWRGSLRPSRRRALQQQRDPGMWSRELAVHPGGTNSAARLRIARQKLQPGQGPSQAYWYGSLVM